MKLSTLKALWKELNDKWFGGLLKEIPIRLTRAKRYYGDFVYIVGSGKETLRISSPMNRDPAVLLDTMLHEMCHQFLYEQTGDADSEHGERFQTVAQIVGISWPSSTCSQVLPLD